MKQYIHKLSQRQSLSFDEMKEAAAQLLSDSVKETEIAAFLLALRTKGETAEEIAALVSVLKENAQTFSVAENDIIDVCGTGGDGVGSFNISTTTAFVLAGAGLTVAKHGNRSISSSSGSSDVLEELGIHMGMTMKESEELLQQTGLTFLFAPTVHSKLKKIMKVRKELRVPTIFNVIGPLTNPLPISYQLMGVYQQEYMPRIAEVMASNDQKRSIIVHGAAGMDEASPLGTNKCLLVENKQIKPFDLHPEEVGLPLYSLQDIKGGSPQENAEILLNVLKGKEGAHLDTVLLNAGLAMFTANKVESIAEGVKVARESVTSGSALNKLREIQKITQNKKQGVTV
ncbi:anthranilate phosphoribosyltransferase [Bacillus spongiae]|uniref:Anthranilate phosphoribosyltransferase n=1 Tax=Bacillus spongiae TaxID=2683610 RepID=A0ABU8HHT6_9BACI